MVCTVRHGNGGCGPCNPADMQMDSNGTDTFAIDVQSMRMPGCAQCNLYISVLTDPTYGGVTASFATLADIILSEPGAMIGFAGKRVIEQTINEKLPKDFQSSEFLFKHGFIDKIVERKDLKDTISKIICMSKGDYNG